MDELRRAFLALRHDDEVAGVIEDDRVQAVTLTGSEPAGRQVAAKAGESLIKTIRAAEMLGMTFRSFRYFAKKYALNSRERGNGTGSARPESCEPELAAEPN